MSYYLAEAGIAVRPVAGLPAAADITNISAIGEMALIRRIERMHWVLLTVSLVTVMGAVAGAHGWVF